MFDAKGHVHIGRRPGVREGDRFEKLSFDEQSLRRSSFWYLDRPEARGSTKWSRHVVMLGQKAFACLLARLRAIARLRPRSELGLAAKCTSHRRDWRSNGTTAKPVSRGGFPAMTEHVAFLMKDIVLFSVSFNWLKQDVIRGSLSGQHR